VKHHKELHLIVGLGNPGAEYENTRHNIGYRAVALWCHTLGMRLSGRRFQSKSASSTLEGHKIICIGPQTYMNRSGEAVRAWATYYGVETGNILVLHDDLDLPLGRIKIVKGGGAGGHKGVLSVMHHLGSTDFPRVKIGIGRPRYNEAIEGYVLTSFYSDETETAEAVIQTAADAAQLCVSEGVESAMNRINCQNLITEGGGKRCRD